MHDFTVGLEQYELQCENRMPIEFKFDEKMGDVIKVLMAKILPSEKYTSIHDFFNAQLYLKFFRAICGETYKQKPLQESSNYEDSQIKAFEALNLLIREQLDHEGIAGDFGVSSQEIKYMVNKMSLQILQLFMVPLFHLMVKNQAIVEIIIALEEDYQQKIQQIIISTQKSMRLQCNGDVSSSLPLLDKLQQFQSTLSEKENEINALKISKSDLEEELNQLKQILKLRESQVNNMKNKLISYEQIDALLYEKDEEIKRISKQAAECQMKLNLIITDLKVENQKKDTKISNMESSLIKSKAMYADSIQNNLILEEQLKELDAATKKVIKNLKEQNLHLTQKFNNQQRVLLETTMEKELKEREYNKLMAHCENERELEIEEGHVEERHTYSNLGEEIQSSFKGGFEEEIGLYERASEDHTRKYNEILTENISLKEKIIKLMGNSNKEEVQKLKKMCDIYKRRRDELEAQRKEEIDILVSMLENSVKLK